MPSPIHAGGLRYHGMSPLVSAAARQGLLAPRAVHQLECFEAAVQFARTEGLIVAPETSHAVAAAIQEAKKAKEEGKGKGDYFQSFGPWTDGPQRLSGLFRRRAFGSSSCPRRKSKEYLAGIKGFPAVV